MDEYDYCYNIIILGNKYTGKTSILNRYIENSFWESQLPSVSVISRLKEIKIDNGERIMLRIDELSVHDPYWKISKSRLKGANGILLIYDVINKHSLDHLNYRLEEIKELIPKDIPKIVVGNKIDY